MGGLEVTSHVVLLASSEVNLHHEYEAIGMKISSSKSEDMVLSEKRVGCFLEMRGKTAPLLEEFKYLGI